VSLSRLKREVAEVMARSLRSRMGGSVWKLRTARNWLLPRCKRTSMYGKLRRIAISSEQASLDLTTQQTVQVTMVQQNINTGGGSIGVVSGEGTVIAHSIQAVNSMAGNNDLKDALSDLLAFIEKSSLAASQKKEGAELVTAVAAQPTRTGLGKLAGWLKVLIEASVLGVEASHVLPAILQRLQECMVLLPG
jgi:hypothetical protein